MPRYFSATPDHGVETSQDMDPLHPGTHIMPGIARAHLTVYEADEACSPTLPTVAELLAKHVDPKTGLLTLEYTDLRLTMDPVPLRELPQDLRVGPGHSFVTHEALRRHRSGQAP